MQKSAETEKMDGSETIPAHNHKPREKETNMGGDYQMPPMGMMGGQDNNNWWPLWLLLFADRGRGGLLGGDGASCCPPVTLEQLNDAQNAVQNSTAQRFDAQANQLNQAQNSIVERTLDITRDQANNELRNETGQRDIQAAIASSQALNLSGQKDITAAIAQCCCDNLLSQKDTQKAIELGACETTRAIEKCCCETQNSIAMQTQLLSQQICADGDKTRQLITQNKIDELQAQLTDAKLANSNLSQTATLQESIREACCQPCRPHPHPWVQGGFVPPGQQG